MRTTRATAWVVYQAAVKGVEHGPNAVCDQAEWDAIPDIAMPDEAHAVPSLPPEPDEPPPSASA